MNRNIRIARQLVRIARELVADAGSSGDAVEKALGMLVDGKTVGDGLKSKALKEIRKNVSVDPEAKRLFDEIAEEVSGGSVRNGSRRFAAAGGILTKINGMIGRGVGKKTILSLLCGLMMAGMISRAEGAEAMEKAGISPGQGGNPAAVQVDGNGGDDGKLTSDYSNPGLKNVTSAANGSSVFSLDRGGAVSQYRNLKLDGRHLTAGFVYHSDQDDGTYLIVKSYAPQTMIRLDAKKFGYGNCDDFANSKGYRRCVESGCLDGYVFRIYGK